MKPSRIDLGTWRADLPAGVVLAALVVPAGIGYAQASGLPAASGLYASIVSLLVYAVIGPSRRMLVGPDSSLTPLIAASIIPLSHGDPARALALAGLLAIMMGLALVVGSVLRLGVVADLLSGPIRLGYLNGVAITIAAGQLPRLCGFTVDSDGADRTLWRFAKGIGDGLVRPAALGVGLVVLVVIAVLRRWPAVPGILLALAGAWAVCRIGGLLDDLPVIGRLPGGLPRPALGRLHPGDIGDLILPAIGIAVITLADSGVLSRSLAVRHRERVDSDHEMAAIGAANIAAGLMGGFPVSASQSRTAAAERAGARSQLAAVAAAATVVLLVLIAPGLTAQIPSSALAAVVLLAAWALADIAALVRLAAMSRVEFALSAVTLIGVVTFGVLAGIAVAVGLSLAAFVYRAWRPYTAELGLLADRPGLHDLSRHPDGARIDGVIVARFDAPLFFANGAVLTRFVETLVASADRPVRWLVLAAEPITDIDTTAAEDLAALDDALAGQQITLLVAELKGPIKDHLERYGMGDRFAGRVFPTLDTAIERCRSRPS